MPRCAMTQRRLSRKGAAIALIAGLLVTGCAYGAVRSFSGPGHKRHDPPLAAGPAIGPRLPRPRITAHPEAQTTSITATFRLNGRAGHVSLECHLDGSPWRSCGRTVTYAAVEPGRHRFFARATRRGIRTSRSASFTWTVEGSVPPVNPNEPPFEIAQSGPPPLLYPGAGPSPLPVTLSNPSPDPIEVTSLWAAITAGPAGCAPWGNVRTEPSPASWADPLVIPAGGTLAVTAAQAPTIELVESGKNQDACRGGTFSLTFLGSARR